MNEQQLDAQGEAHQALSTVITDYGQRVLSDPRMIGNIVTDLLPDLPRERGLLVTAAEADVAGELTQRVQHQHLDPDTAVQMVARSLIERKSIDPASSMWVTTEYAQALGYPVRPAALSAAPPLGATPPPVVGPDPPATVTTYAQYGLPNQQTTPPQDPIIGSAAGYPGYPSQPQAPQGDHAPTGVPWQPQQGSPPWQPPARPPKQRNKGLVYGGAAAAAALVLAVVAVFAFAGSPKSAASSSAPPTVAPTHGPSTSANALAPGVAPLVQLLPSDVNLANCKTAPAALWANPGLVKALQCTDSGLPNGVISAYQMNSSADYQMAFANFNTAVGFPTSPPPTSGCPPTGSSSQGITPWDDTGANEPGYFPVRSGQVLECGLVGSGSVVNQPGYAWTFPSEDAFITAVGAPNTTFAALDSWWTNNADPSASPSPAASS